VRLRPMLIFQQHHADILLDAMEKIVKSFKWVLFRIWGAVWIEKKVLYAMIYERVILSGFKLERFMVLRRSNLMPGMGWCDNAWFVFMAFGSGELLGMTLST
jgi:hypothetical protein